MPDGRDLAAEPDQGPRRLGKQFGLTPDEIRDVPLGDGDGERARLP